MSTTPDTPALRRSVHAARHVRQHAAARKKGMAGDVKQDSGKNTPEGNQKPGTDVFYHQGSGTASQATPRGRHRIRAGVGFELAI